MFALMTDLLQAPESRRKRDAILFIASYTLVFIMFMAGNGELATEPPVLRKQAKDFPGGPVAKTPGSQCRGPGSFFGQGTRSHMPQAIK